jgi:molybdopterin synthase catalytic subunit
VVELQTAPIVAAELIASVASEGDGAVALFLGTVRSSNRGREVLCLEYHAYEKMARLQMADLARKAEKRFKASRVALVHRMGRLEVGEVAVGVAVAAAHRSQAMDACRFLIDALKKQVPIWKKEFYEGGSVWLEGGEEGSTTDR